MARTIWKYEWNGKAPTMSFDMPRGAMPISAHVQGKGFNIWAVCDPSVPEKEKRNFEAVQTGGKLPEGQNIAFVGTVVLDEGYFVLHIFEVR